MTSTPLHQPGLPLLCAVRQLFVNMVFVLAVTQVKSLSGGRAGCSADDLCARGVVIVAARV
jgi:hypothetical protein